MDSRNFVAYHSSMKTRGERLKERRLALGLTLREAAEAVGLSTPGLQNLERGDVMPSLEIGVNVARIYQRSIQWLLTGEGPISASIPIVGTTDTGPDQNWKAEGFIPPLGWVKLCHEKHSAFGLKITNWKGVVRYSAGDVLLIDTDEPVKGGEDVLISLKTGQLIAGNLIRISETELVIDSLADRSDRSVYSQSELAHVWAIIGTINGMFISHTVID